MKKKKKAKKIISFLHHNAKSKEFSKNDNLND